MTSITDSEICSLLRTRKMEGMEMLFRKYYKPLVVWADTFLHDVQRAEDVVQDFFTRLWEKPLAETLLSATLRSYLFTAVRNASLNALEKTDPLSRACDVALHDEPWEEYDDFEDEVFRRVEKEVGKLPPRGQEVIRCVYLRGMTYKQTAEEMGITAGTVNALLVAALKRLREVLGDDPAKLLCVFFAGRDLNE